MLRLKEAFVSRCPRPMVERYTRPPRCMRAYRPPPIVQAETSRPAQTRLFGPPTRELPFLQGGVPRTVGKGGDSSRTADGAEGQKAPSKSAMHFRAGIVWAPFYSRDLG